MRIGLVLCLAAVWADLSVVFAQSSESLSPPPAATPSVVQPAATPSALSSPPLSSKARAIAWGSCHVEEPYIAMTFDDGPNAKLTPQLLDILESRHIRATFFVVGINAKANPSILKRMKDDGDEIGNHSWSHPQLPKIGMENADQEITDTSKAIEEATGSSPIFLRPPYGAMTPYLRHHFEQEFGMTLIYWSVDPEDWRYRDPEHVHDEILKQVKPGAIILSHDIHATTVAAMPSVFDDLLAQGYKFVTVSQLIALNTPPPPKVIDRSSSPSISPVPTP